MVIILVIAIIIFGLWWLMQKGYKLPYLPKQEANVPAIENRSDLNAAQKELDAENLDQIDSGLNEINSDVSTL